MFSMSINVIHIVFLILMFVATSHAPKDIANDKKAKSETFVRLIAQQLINDHVWKAALPASYVMNPKAFLIYVTHLIDISSIGRMQLKTFKEEGDTLHDEIEADLWMANINVESVDSAVLLYIYRTMDGNMNIGTRELLLMMLVQQFILNSPALTKYHNDMIALAKRTEKCKNDIGFRLIAELSKRGEYNIIEQGLECVRLGKTPEHLKAISDALKNDDEELQKLITNVMSVSQAIANAMTESQMTESAVQKTPLAEIVERVSYYKDNSGSWYNFIRKTLTYNTTKFAPISYINWRAGLPENHQFDNSKGTTQHELEKDFSNAVMFQHVFEDVTQLPTNDYSEKSWIHIFGAQPCTEKSLKRLHVDVNAMQECKKFERDIVSTLKKIKKDENGQEKNGHVPVRPVCNQIYEWYLQLYQAYSAELKRFKPKNKPKDEDEKLEQEWESERRENKKKRAKEHAMRFIRLSESLQMWLKVRN